MKNEGLNFGKTGWMFWKLELLNSMYRKFYQLCLEIYTLYGGFDIMWVWELASGKVGVLGKDYRCQYGSLLIGLYFELFSPIDFLPLSSTISSSFS